MNSVDQKAKQEDMNEGKRFVGGGLTGVEGRWEVRIIRKYYIHR